MKMKHIKWLLCLALVVVLGACASAPTDKPDSALTQAKEAVAQARQNKAGQYAKKMFYQANEELKSAQKLANTGGDDDYAKAKRIAEKATVDAQLAQARAEAKQAQDQTKQVNKTIKALGHALNQEDNE